MFSGLVQAIGSVERREDASGDTRLSIRAPEELIASRAVGASVAVQGICLTVVAKQRDVFTVQLSAETLDRTTAGAWRVGTQLNLEPSLTLGDELGGHFVFGHCDAVAETLDVYREGGSYRVRFSLPATLAPMVAEKGSIAIDGVSLTVNEVNGESFGVNLIPHTWSHTTLARLGKGERVNLEADMLARYVLRARAFRHA